VAAARRIVSYRRDASNSGDELARANSPSVPVAASATKMPALSAETNGWHAIIDVRNASPLKF
jgi:hypothetical protein